MTQPPVRSCFVIDETCRRAKLQRSENRRRQDPEYCATHTGNCHPSLRAAFDDVTRDRARRESVPVVGGPAKLVHQRRKR